MRVTFPVIGDDDQREPRVHSAPLLSQDLDAQRAAREVEEGSALALTYPPVVPATLAPHLVSNANFGAGETRRDFLRVEISQPSNKRKGQLNQQEKHDVGTVDR